MTRVEKKFLVKDNTEIKNIYNKLNSAQKVAISLFDTDRSGILDKDEAKAFNSSNFSLQESGDLFVYLNLSSGKKSRTVVTKEEMDETALSLGTKKITTGVEKVGNKTVKHVTIQSMLNKEQTVSTRKAEARRKRATEEAETQRKQATEEAEAQRKQAREDALSLLKSILFVLIL